MFGERLNRFTARVEAEGRTELVHVKNTGRLGELLRHGAQVWLSRADSPGRRTAYDLVTVRREDGLLFNVDSQAPNRIVQDWLQTLAFDELHPEYRYGASRMDFFMRRGETCWLMEVKGCTLLRDGIGLFPDAPTERGVRHLRELTAAVRDGYRAILAFVIQMDGVAEVRANRAADPAFANALAEAADRGVRILSLPCHVTPDSLTLQPQEALYDTFAN